MPSGPATCVETRRRACCAVRLFFQAVEASVARSGTVQHDGERMIPQWVKNISTMKGRGNTGEGPFSYGPSEAVIRMAHMGVKCKSAT